MRKLWSDKAWEDYLYWQQQDKKTLRKINKLIESIERATKASSGASKPIGKAERLRYSRFGLCSARIDQKNRLVYKVEDDATLAIISCRGHYE